MFCMSIISAIHDHLNAMVVNFSHRVAAGVPTEGAHEQRLALWATTGEPQRSEIPAGCCPQGSRSSRIGRARAAVPRSSSRTDGSYYRRYMSLTWKCAMAAVVLYVGV